MKALTYILLLLSSAILWSCEVILDPSEKDSGNILTINALVTNEAPLTVYVTRAYPISAPPVDNSELDYMYLPVLFYRHQKDYYNDEVKECRVSYQVNGGKMTEMRYDTASHGYVSEYRPSEGDCIRILATAGSRHAESTVTLPPKSAVEVLGYEIKYSRRTDNSLLPNSYYGFLDSIMSIKLRISDVESSERNYYRLQVRAVSSMGEHFYRQISDNEEIETLTDEYDWFEDRVFPGTFYVSVKNNNDYYLMNDVFSSADPLLSDDHLDKGYPLWDAGMTNIFDNHLFRNGSYEVTVSSRLLVGSDRHVEIEMQSISKEYYHYLRAYYLYRISELYSSQDYYSCDIHIPTNVEGGWGVVGAMTQGESIILR